MKMVIPYEGFRNIASEPCDRAIRLARSPSEAALMLTRAASSFIFLKKTRTDYETIDEKHAQGSVTVERLAETARTV
jgi:hypothetical protein